MPPNPDQLLTQPSVQIVPPTPAPVIVQPVPVPVAVQPAPIIPAPVAVVQPDTVAVHRRHVPGWLAPLIFFVLVGALAYSVRLASISGGSMEPTLHEGQHLVIDALTWRLSGIHRGDIIIFTNPHDTNTVEVKRVIGLPDEAVLIQGGTIGVTPKDGKYHEFPQGTEIGGNGGVANYQIQLGPQDFFVLGDNRPKSTDSRDFGGVQPVNIIGRVVASF